MLSKSHSSSSSRKSIQEKIKKRGQVDEMLRNFVREYRGKPLGQQGKDIMTRLMQKRFNIKNKKTAETALNYILEGMSPSGAAMRARKEEKEFR